jgi:hypothetical protein
VPWRKGWLNWWRRIKTIRRKSAFSRKLSKVMRRYYFSYIEYTVKFFWAHVKMFYIRVHWRKMGQDDYCRFLQYVMS